MKQLIICSLLAIAAICVGVKPNPANAQVADETAAVNVDALNQAATSSRIVGECAGGGECKVVCPICAAVYPEATGAGGTARRVNGICPSCGHVFH